MMIKVNGVDLEFPMEDVDFYEKYMEHAVDMDNVMEISVEKDQRSDYKFVAELMRKKCKAVKDFLDHLFGEGTGDRVCGEKDNTEICLDAYLAIIEGVEKSGDSANKKMEAFVKRRARRRAAEKK